MCALGVGRLSNSGMIIRRAAAEHKILAVQGHFAPGRKCGAANACLCRGRAAREGIISTTSRHPNHKSRGEKVIMPTLKIAAFCGLLCVLSVVALRGEEEADAPEAEVTLKIADYD